MLYPHNKEDIDSRIAIEHIKAGKSVFITGHAGSGKTRLIQKIKEQVKDIIFTSSTGISAIQINGETCHRLFSIKVHYPSISSAAQLQKGEAKKLRNIKAILFEEVSMTRCDTLDIIDLKMRNACGNQLPFGGKQVIFIGDFMQLGAILATNSPLYHYLCGVYHQSYIGHAAFHAFHSKAWQEVKPLSIVLSGSHRHQEPAFAQALKSIRMGINIDEALRVINTRFDVPAPNDVTRLFMTRLRAEQWNAHMFSTLHEREVCYFGQTKGEQTNLHQIVPPIIKLKVGARVIIVANDKSGRAYANGDTGVVVELHRLKVTVKLDRGGEVDVRPHLWEEVSYNANLVPKVVSQYKQLPLMVGYGMTIHKSQGLTMNDALIDLSSPVLSKGLPYVGLSRVRSLEGLYLKNPITESLILVDEECATFTQNAENEYRKRKAKDIKELVPETDA